MTFILSLLSNSSLRKAFLVLVFIGSILLGSISVYKHIYTEGYNAGTTYQEQVYKKQQDAAKDLLDAQQKQADKDRSDLNTQISGLKDTLAIAQKALEDKQNKQTQEVIDYAKTSEGVGTCFDPDSNGLRIINNSFPDSN